MEGIAEGCVVVDSTLTVQYCNPAFAAIMGRAVADLFSVCLSDELPALAGSGFTHLCELTFQNGRSQRGGAWLGGRWYEIRTHPVTGGVLALLGDATTQRRAEDDLANSEMQLRTLLDQACSFYWVTDDQFHLLRLGAPGSKDATPRQYVAAGDSLFELFATTDPGHPAIRMHRRALVGEPVDFSIELHNRQYNVSLRPNRDNLGRVSTVTGLAREASSPLQFKSEYPWPPQEPSLHAQKGRGLDLLVGGVVHDFNNLLVGILNGAELLARDLPAGEVRDTAEMITRAAQRARDVARQILVTVGKGQSTYQRFDINLLLRENLYLLKLAFPDRVQVQADLFDGSLLIYADPGQIQQVVMNLLVNAAEALSPSGGTVRVATRLVKADGAAATIASETANPYVCVEIADNGQGMAADVQARIFEPFFTTKQAGHGLGLAAVKNILLAHNGLINVTSSVGKGTTFHIFLPIVSADGLPEAPAAVVATPSAQREVLIVDDESHVLDVVSRMLRNAGYATQTAASGPKALALLIEQPRIGVVILDLKMPEMDGLETLRRLADIRSDLRVIITSGCSGADEAVAKDPRVIGFIPKPYVLATLVKMVQEGLDSVRAT
jgi:signal transduction histidine kinase